MSRPVFSPVAGTTKVAEALQGLLALGSSQANQTAAGAADPTLAARQGSGRPPRPPRARAKTALQQASGQHEQQEQQQQMAGDRAEDAGKRGLQTQVQQQQEPTGKSPSVATTVAALGQSIVQPVRRAISAAAALLSPAAKRSREAEANGAADAEGSGSGAAAKRQRQQTGATAAPQQGGATAADGVHPNAGAEGQNAAAAGAEAAALQVQGQSKAAAATMPPATAAGDAEGQNSEEAAVEAGEPALLAASHAPAALNVTAMDDGAAAKGQPGGAVGAQGASATPAKSGRRRAKGAPKQRHQPPRSRQQQQHAQQTQQEEDGEEEGKQQAAAEIASGSSPKQQADRGEAVAADGPESAPAEAAAQTAAAAAQTAAGAPASGAAAAGAASSSSKQCKNCGSCETTGGVWRREQGTGAYLCNMCGGFLVRHGRHRTAEEVAEAAARRAQAAAEERRCTHCSATRTPNWRRHPQTRKKLCDACGRYLSKHDGQLLPLGRGVSGQGGQA